MKSYWQKQLQLQASGPDGEEIRFHRSSSNKICRQITENKQNFIRVDVIFPLPTLLLRYILVQRPKTPISKAIFVTSISVCVSYSQCLFPHTFMHHIYTKKDRYLFHLIKSLTFQLPLQLPILGISCFSLGQLFLPLQRHQLLGNFCSFLLSLTLNFLQLSQNDKVKKNMLFYRCKCYHKTQKMSCIEEKIKINNIISKETFTE